MKKSILQSIFPYAVCCVMLVCVTSPRAYAGKSQASEVDCFIEPSVVVKVGSDTPGVVDTVLVDRGDFVSKGQVIATLNAEVEHATMELARSRAELEATIELKRANYQFALRVYKRTSDLYKDGLIPQQDMDKAQTNLSMTQRELEEALEKKKIAALEFKQAQKALERKTIISPINGIVVERYLSPGERVEQQPIMKLAQLNPLHVEVIAPLSMIGSVKTGDKVEVTPEQPVRGSYMGRVQIVDRVVDAASGTFGIRIELANPKYAVPAGIRCTVRFLGR
jgi:RND family efflux transporter MFP subunit